MLTLTIVEAIGDRYGAAIAAYITAITDEQASLPLSQPLTHDLERARQIGCLALKAGLDITALNEIHKRSLRQCWQTISSSHDSLRAIEGAADFFAHCLQPFTTQSFSKQHVPSKLSDSQKLKIELQERDGFGDLTHVSQCLYREGGDLEQAEMAFPHELSLTPLADDGGVCISHDITKRRQTEFELRKAQQLLQAILDNSPSAIVVVDWQGKYMLVNRSYEDLVAKTSQDLIGKNVTDIWAADIATTLIQGNIYSIESRRPLEVEEEIPLEDGTHTYFTVKFPLTDDLGIPYAVCGISSDISDRKKSEAAMRVSENRLQTIIGNISDGILIVEADGRIIFANPSAEKILGMASQALIDSYLDMPAQFDRSTELEIISGTRRAGIGEMQLVKIEWDGSPAYIAAIRDITDRKQVEKQIQRSLQEKEVLLKEIHHRVKNNLQVISSLLSIQARRLSDSESHHALTDCQERILAIALIHEQLYQAKDLSQIDLKEYLQSLANRIACTYANHYEKVKLRLKLSAATVNIETAMPCGLIVNELISNSFKHAFPNQRSGKICVELAQVDSERLTLSVYDNGIGLASKVDTIPTQSLGLMLIRKLVGQLEGVATWDYTMGTKFQLVFKGLEYPTRI